MPGGDYRALGSSELLMEAVEIKGIYSNVNSLSRMILWIKD